MRIWLNFGWHLGRTNDAMVSMDRSPLSQTKVLDLCNYLGELNYGILCYLRERDRDPTNSICKLIGFLC